MRLIFKISFIAAFAILALAPSNSRATGLEVNNGRCAVIPGKNDSGACASKNPREGSVLWVDQRQACLSDVNCQWGQCVVKEGADEAGKQRTQSAICDAAPTCGEGAANVCKYEYITASSATEGAAAAALEGATVQLINPIGGDPINPRGVVAATAFINKIIRGALGVMGAMALLIFVWSAQGLIFAAGNQEKIKKSIGAMIWAAVGILVTLASYLLLSAIMGGLLG